MSANDYHSSLQSLWREGTARFHSVLDGASHEEANRRPEKEQWSTAECLYHVVVSNEGYVEPMRIAVSNGGRRGDPPFSYGPLSRWFLASVGPDGRKVRTFRALEPPKAEERSNLEVTPLLDRLDRSTSQFVELIDQSRGLDLARIRIRSPFLKLVRLPLGIAFEAMGQHTIRHVMQAERVRDSF